VIDAARALVRAVVRELGRIRMRLLAVNLVVALVPVAGVEFARLFERQLLGSLESDMRHQAVLVRRFIESALSRGIALDAPEIRDALVRAARDTRTRVRIIDAARHIVIDSHAEGPPEGPEPMVPGVLGLGTQTNGARRSGVWNVGEPRWPVPEQRLEVREAFAGKRSARTRIRDRAPNVLLFIAEPIYAEGRVVAVVYAVRSTEPVLFQLYRIRTGLLRVQGVAFVLTLLVTLGLALTISRPLGKLARAARRIESGERGVEVPIVGSGEIRELASALASMTEQLDLRLRYIADFTADVAHELKSPLTSIRGAAELLEDVAEGDPVARARFLGNIKLDVERLDRLVSRLLELGRVEAAQTMPVVLDLEALLRAIASRTHDVDVTVEGGPFISARPHDLEMAVKNLVENARRHAPPGSRVSVRAVIDPVHARIEVHDEGPGIPSDHLPRVFDRFFTTAAEENGTGLGLAIVRAVAMAHGGEAKVRSAKGEGTTFTLTVPTRGRNV
jgi:two-component system sensor histidine kinase ChvG